MRKTFLLLSLVLFSAVAASAQETVTITVGGDLTDEAGVYTTFVSDKSLNFSAVDGLKAYVGKKEIAYNETTWAYTAKLTLTEVELVPAGTPVVLIATTAGDYTVPVGTAPEEILDNDLKVATEAVKVNEITKEGSWSSSYEGTVRTVLQMNNIYEFSYDTWDNELVGTAVGFGLNDSETLAAGTVFLQVDDAEIDALDDRGFIALNVVDPNATAPEYTIGEAAKLTAEGDFLLKLTDAQITYVKTGRTEYAVVEDATGGILLSGIGLADLGAGTKLNGAIALTAASSWGAILISSTSATAASIAALETSEGTVTPFDLVNASDDELNVWIESYNYRLTNFGEATIAIESGSYGDDYYVNIEAIDQKAAIYDQFGNIDEETYLAFKEGDRVTLEGFLGDVYGTLAFIPTKVTPISETTGVSAAIAVSDKSAPVFNLNGQRLTAPTKGLNIIGGKKVLVK